MKKLDKLRDAQLVEIADLIRQYGKAAYQESMLAWAYRVTLRDQKPCFCMAIFPSSSIISCIICANFRIFEIHFTKGFPFSIMSSFHS